MILALVGILAFAGAAVGPIMSDVEQAPYTVIETHGTIEIRDYDPMVIAQTTASGPREEAISKGFRIIADYIFGNNESATGIAMTAPVIQQASEKIAMTAPVLQQENGKDTWDIRFVMPRTYTLKTLPTPKNGKVQLQAVPTKRFAVLRFSGSTQDANVQEKRHTLESFIATQRLTPLASATYAFFNPPWTLPFLRRNEVMIEIVR